MNNCFGNSASSTGRFSLNDAHVAVFYRHVMKFTLNNLFFFFLLLMRQWNKLKHCFNVSLKRLAARFVPNDD